jgi:diguanylate cyclase (GGDEF)-like protein
VVEAEEKLDAAKRQRNSRDRDQRRRIAWLGMTAASYAVDTLFLALFAMAGTISGTIAPAYGAAAAAISTGTYAATASGWNLQRPDPNLVAPLSYLGIAMQLGVVLAAPQIAFPVLANLFTVFAFGMIWLPLRDSAMVWTLGITGTATVFYAVQGRIGVPVSSAFELTLVWLYFSLILGRCLLLSVNANEMRARLANSGRKLAASLAQVEQLASHDELTGTLNRRALMAALERERSRAERGGAAFSIAMIDLDHFKRVNDAYGHGAGDEVLRALAATVHDTMRATDVFGRYGGEEFLMLLFGATPALALKAMERIRATVAAKNWSSITPELSVTLSAGIASHCKGETTEQLLHRADLALYQAKDAGRNTVIANPS